ncbi:MAG: EutN/CcmL family microcompartment protein [Deltaproteobacteria bacterium]|nr:EutN/CcmL family microcompartment protein [Deltaproteobacteria bacterium]
MFLGRVIGTCVATKKAPGLEGVRLLIVEPLDSHGVRTGDPLVAADPLGAAPGERVYYVSSREASLALEESFVPIDAAIVGLIDELDVLASKGKSFVRGHEKSEGAPR